MISSIMALSLGPHVSLTLVQEGGSWRFESWSCCPWGNLPCPDAADLAQRFSSAEEAAAHFRALFPRAPQFAQRSRELETRELLRLPKRLYGSGQS